MRLPPRARRRRSPADDAALKTRLRAIRLVAFDFDGVFTDNTVYVCEDGSETVRCWRSDGFGLQALTRAGISVVVISMETNPVVSARCRKLGVRCVQRCNDKRSALQAIARELELSMNQIAFVGNDTNDVGCLKTVGLPVVVQDAHPSVLPHARYRTQALGGHGAVREVCDLILSAQQRRRSDG